MGMVKSLSNIWSIFDHGYDHEMKAGHTQSALRNFLGFAQGRASPEDCTQSFGITQATASCAVAAHVSPKGSCHPPKGPQSSERTHVSTSSRALLC